MALLAGIPVEEYASLPQWKLVYYNAVATDTLQLMRRQKEAEIKATAAEIGNHIGKMFSK